MKSEPVGDVMMGMAEHAKNHGKTLTIAENMTLWKSVEDTDPKYVSPIAGTDLSNVDATYQKMRATEMWGPYGKRWGLRDIELGRIPETGLPAEIWAKAKFYCPESEFEIIDDIGWKRGDDCRKKLMTRLLKKALSYLGFSALIYMGDSDDDELGGSDATKDHEKIFETLRQAAQIANNEKQLRSVQDQCAEKKLGRFHRSSLAAVCAQRAALLGIEMPDM